MSTDEIAQAVQGGETMYAEFKSAAARPESLATAFISFLNTEGGVLWLGIEDDGTVTGVADVDGARQRVDQILANNVTPRATAFIEQVEVGGKPLLKITLPRGVDRPLLHAAGSVLCSPECGEALGIARRDPPNVYGRARLLLRRIGAHGDGAGGC